MVKAKKWVLASQFEGEPKDSNFRLEEEELPALKDGECMCEAIYHSVDPYMRYFKMDPGSIIVGEQVARVVESRNKDYPVGCLVQIFCGWRTRVVFTPEDDSQFFLNIPLKKVPDLGNKETSLSLGAMGPTGMSAYFGLLEICKPEEGETVLVNGAAGAVGSVVGQIAKIKGCKVIGFTGTNEKCDWLKSLGFDHVFNYKETDVDDAIKHAAPDGVDCFFDNVGGEFASKALNHMKPFGRVSVCGAISTYNDNDPPTLPFPFNVVLSKQLKVEGFLFIRWRSQLPEGEAQMLKWINEDQIKYKETVFEGFDQMPQAFMTMLKGGNTGKMLVKA